MTAEPVFSIASLTALVSWLLLILVGSWEVEDARSRGIAHGFVVPCLILTFLFGPGGWLLYQGVRRIAGRY